MGRVLALATGLALWTAPARSQGLSPAEERIVQWIEGHEAEAIGLLQRVVDINSGTMNHAGVRAVGEVFGTELEALGFAVRWIEMPDSVNRAGHLFAEREGRPGAKRFLLIGHLDTVFEPDHPFQRFERAGDRASGPGVVDMKGGDVTIVYALKALAAAGALDDASYTVALIGDEESAGLPLAVSRGDLVEAGRRADLALGFEAGEGGKAVIARRGSSSWKLRVTGQQAHSSTIFSESAGSGAVYETARILWRFHEELRVSRSITFNPGIVLGGTDVTYDDAEKRGAAAGKTNVIAQTAVVEGDLRFLTEEEKEETREKMRQIVAEHLPGASGEITFEDKYPAMPPSEENRRLLDLYSRVSRDLGLTSVEPYDPVSRGAADISFVAPHVAGIDGLGPWGRGAHSLDETLDVPSLSVATRRAALLLHRLASREGGPETAPAAPDLLSRVLHHAVPGHPTCPGETGQVEPGARTCFTLLYGWTGDEPAPNVRLSIAVSQGATLVAAGREPTSRSSAGWRWDLGTLPPATFGSILVQVDVAPEVEGPTLRLDAYVEGDVEEQWRGNNGSWAAVAVKPGS